MTNFVKNLVGATILGARRLRVLFFLAVCGLLLAPGAPAASPGDEVILIYNRRVPDSKSVADYYAQLRSVPPNQIFGYNLTTNDNISRADFRDALQKPLAKALEDQKLWRLASEMVPGTPGRPARTEWRVVESKIRYAVLCYGMPLRIEKDPLLTEEGMDKLRPEMRRDEAAVDSELALLPLFAQHPPLLGPLRNLLAGTTNGALLNPTNGVLMVTRLDGPSAIIARGLVEKAIQAEDDGLWGRAYFDLRNITDPGFKPGDDWIRSAANIAHQLGFETVVDENPGLFPPGFPMSQIAYYCGWYSQDIYGPFTLPKVEFMPGAFAYHLHSYSALDLHSRTRGWVGPFLAKGVTATMGTTDEPYLGGTPDVGTFTARFLYQGFTFGEAAYASQPVLSWQTTVVGDPLYRPFGKNPELQHINLVRKKSPLLEWSYLRLVNLNLVVGKPVGELISLLEGLELTRTSAVLTEKLSELYTAAGKPASAIEANRAALKLDPSPEQRIRLRMNLSDRLVAQNQSAEADEDLRQLLTENPDYPDRVGILRRMVGLARELKREGEVSRLEAEIAKLAPPANP